MSTEKLYYNDYFKQNNLKYEKGKYNIVRTPCGSGKTYHCLDVITQEYSGVQRRLGKDSKVYRCLYVTDTSALKESVICAYENNTGRKVNDSRNLEVITYAKLAYLLDGKDVANFAKDYDYIFLDEIHQLFVYSDKYDGRTDEDKSEYIVVIESLELLVRNTTLICLSATPEPLFEYIVKEIGQGEQLRIRDIVPVTELHNIKCYTTEHTIPVFDIASVVKDIKLKEDDKLFIFAQTIRELKSYEEICQNKGYSTVALWSIRYNNQKAEDEDEELVLQSKRMNKYQLEARKQLLETGEYDTQVLLLNGAYESGINIENSSDSKQRTIHVIVASNEQIQITQARGRVRHNIDCLYHSVDTDTTEYTEYMGVDNNKHLCSQLDVLVKECLDNPQKYVGKEGLSQLALYLNLWKPIRDKKGRNKGRTRLTSVKAINDHFLLLDLPYKIEVEEVKKRVDGKSTTVRTYYVVRTDIDEEFDDEEFDEVEEVIVVTRPRPRNRW